MRDFYTCGKPLAPESAAYVERRADRELSRVREFLSGGEDEEEPRDLLHILYP